MISTGSDDFDFILERAAMLKEANRLAYPDPSPLTLPANFSVDLGAMRMSITFEPVGRGAQKTAA